MARKSVRVCGARITNNGPSRRIWPEIRASRVTSITETVPCRKSWAVRSNYYRGVAQFFFVHGGSNERYLIRVDSAPSSTKILGHVFSLPSCEASRLERQHEHCHKVTRVALTSEYYKGDRSMRESGFDVSFRFGPFSADTHHYAPVCLNSLLYKTEMDLARA